MLNKQEINLLKENIEWAKLDMERGSVYHIKWAQKYAEDVQLLLRAMKAYECHPETEVTANEVLHER